LAILEKTCFPDDPELAIFLQNLGELEMGLGKYADAEAHFTRALEIFEKAQGPDDRDVALTLEQLTLLYHRMGQPEKAEEFDMRAKAIRAANPRANP
jgi:tetratricopeptide (TPR) repeat protein